MAELINSRSYWHYDDMEEGVIVKKPVRGIGRTDETREWDYGGPAASLKVGDRVIVLNNRDSDHELSIEVPGDDGTYYIWDGCVEPAVKPIPDNVDLKNPTDIEKFLKEDA